MNALADWIAKLVQILYCINIDIYIGSIVAQVVDHFVHSSGPFGGRFFVWGVLQNPEEPPLATALSLCSTNLNQAIIGAPFHWAQTIVNGTCAWFAHVSFT